MIQPSTHSKGSYFILIASNSGNQYLVCLSENREYVIVGHIFIKDKGCISDIGKVLLLDILDYGEVRDATEEEIGLAAMGAL